MLKPTFSILSIVLLLSTFFHSCTKCPNCPENSFIGEELQNDVKVGDQRLFLSADGDSLIFTCESVVVDAYPCSLDSRQEECCSPCLKEYLSQNFLSPEGHSLQFHHVWPPIGWSLRFADSEYYCDGTTGAEIESIELAGESFTDITECGEGNQFVYSSGGVIIGFTIDSIDWIMAP